MLYFSRWKATATILTALIICFFAVPNFFPEATVKSWPKWAQRHIVLGLDLQGGSHILLEVDSNAVRKEKVETLRDDVRRVVRENRLGAPAAVTIRGQSVEFRVREGGDTGRPVVIADPGSPIAQAFREMARKVAQRVSMLAENAALDPSQIVQIGKF